MADLLRIEAFRRTQTGKAYNRKLRKQGRIPGNILGSKGQMIELDPKWLSKVWRSGGKFSMILEGFEAAVAIKEVQIDPVKRLAQHVDLSYL